MPSRDRRSSSVINHSMRMHLKSLLKVAGDKGDDTEDDPALQEDDQNEKPFPGGVDAMDRTIGQVESARDFSGFVKIHVRAWCAGRSRNLSSLRSHETLEREP
jgi:hypothetical protein